MVQQGGGITSSTSYLPGGVEEVRPDGSLVKYYAAGGLNLGLNTAHDASGIAYLLSDGLGSVQEVLDGAGQVTASQLHSPYGQVRYRSGVMPTSKGFTGQRDDAAVNGLLYYDARSYDPLLGQFTTGDSVADGLNRYGYVAGNPTTRTDPTGHRLCADCSGGGGGDDSGGCHSDSSCGCYSNCGSGDSTGGGGGPSPKPNRHSDYGPPLASGDEMDSCMQDSGAPQWCSRYYEYTDGTWRTKTLGPDQADYFYFIVGAGVGLVGQIVYFFVPGANNGKGQWLKSIGGGLAISASIPDILSAAFGYGIVFAKGGKADPRDVIAFLEGGSWANEAAIFLGASWVGNDTGQAIQYFLGNSVTVYAVGGSYTRESGPPGSNAWKCIITIVWCALDT